LASLPHEDHLFSTQLRQENLVPEGSENRSLILVSHRRQFPESSQILRVEIVLYRVYPAYPAVSLELLSLGLRQLSGLTLPKDVKIRLLQHCRLLLELLLQLVLGIEIPGTNWILGVREPDDRINHPLVGRSDERASTVTSRAADAGALAAESGRNAARLGHIELSGGVGNILVGQAGVYVQIFH